MLFMPTWMKVKAEHSWGLTCLYRFSASGLHLGPLRRVLLISRILFFFLEQPSPAHKFPVSPVLTPLLWKQISSSQEAIYWGDSGGKKKVSPHFPKEHIRCKQCSGRPGLVPQRIHQRLFLERTRPQRALTATDFWALTMCQALWDPCIHS